MIGPWGTTMKKRSFLLPLAVSLTALTAVSGIANAKPVMPIAAPIVGVASPAASAPAKTLVLQRATGTKMAQYGHSSHGSHSSHSSHSSHHSSR